MKRIDRLAVRIAALTAKQDAEQNWPRFTLHLDDGQTVRVIAMLPEALVKLAALNIMSQHEVLSIDRPEQLDGATEQLYDLFEHIVLNNSAFREMSWHWKDDSDILPPEEPEEPTGHEPAPERNHNLI